MLVAASDVIHVHVLVVRICTSGWHLLAAAETNHISALAFSSSLISYVKM